MVQIKHLKNHVILSINKGGKGHKLWMCKIKTATKERKNMLYLPINKAYLRRFWLTLSLIFHSGYCHSQVADKKKIITKFITDCPQDFENVYLADAKELKKWGRSASFRVYLTKINSQKEAENFVVSQGLRFGQTDRKSRKVDSNDIKYINVDGKTIEVYEIKTAKSGIQYSEKNGWYFILNSYDLMVYLYKLGFRSGIVRLTSEPIKVPDEYRDSWEKGKEFVDTDFTPKTEAYVWKAIHEKHRRMKEDEKT